jgi:hypothetical protein
MLWMVLIGFMAWTAVSCAIAPLVATVPRRCDVLDRARSIEVMQAMAQHPASRAA